MVCHPGAEEPVPPRRGQTLMEYAVLLAFIAIVVVGAVLAFGNALREYWENIVNMFP